MTIIIFRAILFVLGIWVLWQLLNIFLVRNKRSGSASKKTSNSGKNMVKDPVCGMYMDPRLAVTYQTKTGVFYFCSEECKHKFLQENSGRESGASPHKD
jgi:uncharacterized protein